MGNCGTQIREVVNGEESDSAKVARILAVLSSAVDTIESNEVTENEVGLKIVPDVNFRA